MEEKILTAILENHHEYTKKVAKDILNELKKNSEDYKDLKDNIAKLKKQVFFKTENIRKYEVIFIEIDKQIEKEMNDLPLSMEINTF